MARLKEKYNQEVSKALMEKFGYKNVMQLPKLEKIVLNMGLGEAIANSKAMDNAVEDMTIIVGQKPVVTRAKKSIAGFKLREGMPIGVKVTLRGERMYPKSFDGRGNYTMGVKEQLIFPEIEYDKVDKIRGMDITVVTSAPTDEEAFELLKQLGMPFSA